MIDPRSFLSAMARMIGASSAPAPTPEASSSADEAEAESSLKHITARYQIGQVVRHRMFNFRGVIFDVDPQFANTEEWYQAIPEEVRPAKDQPYYHLFAENDRTHYVAYVSEQNLVLDDHDHSITHPNIPDVFDVTDEGRYVLRPGIAN